MSASKFKINPQQSPISDVLTQARRLLWMYTSRDVYRMLVVEGKWTADQYEIWLGRALADALIEP